MPTRPLHQGLALEPTECVATVLGLAQIFREMGARTIAVRGNPDRRRHSRARRNKQRSRSATVARPQRCARLGSAPICGRASVRRAPETAPARSAGRHRSPAPPRRARAHQIALDNDPARVRHPPSLPTAGRPSITQSGRRLPIDAPGYRVARRLGTQARCSLCSRPRVGCCIYRQRIWP